MCSETKTIICKEGNLLLVCVEGQVELGGETYNTWHHEIWTDYEKYEAGISEEWLDDGPRIYCTSLAGYSNEAALSVFKSRLT
ncbi:hypothetical protein SAMN05661091_4163 [Paenibacillus uliginis N3/975]|uniref:Uncharacterized protein n=1 Tax=Paenibacillus uliginis N3/975 TaxID=1313296 RepID=A0A1X7HKD9_9BACL|nr:hypothetical protein [Paenibacillus uliginis]SMF88188.1 hypothetical protein SAMN05661091_4163 [Paenibacillus uliginis N3/975]